MCPDFVFEVYRFETARRHRDRRSRRDDRDHRTSERVLMEGSEALARAAIAAGCRFFAGYPMTPFTEVLEHFARLLPDAGGVCINAESELEAVGMAWGALATGARAATGSTGQGLSLMQESFSEITLAELPLVIFNMARGQQDYFQATRGGGHGDYRHIVLAPQDVREGVEHVQLAFHLADKWRNPVLVYGDYLLAHTQEAISIDPIAFPELPKKDWAVDGSSSGQRQEPGRHAARRRQDRPARDGPRRQGAVHRHQDPAHGARGTVRARLLRRRGDDHRRVRVAREVREVRDHASCGRPGTSIGYLRPITLWPFPYDGARRRRRRRVR